MPKVNATVTYKEIPGYPGYRVGDDGSVWSCLKRRRTGSGRAGWYLVMSATWRQLSASPNQRGYLRVSLSRDKVKSKLYLHRVVLEAFIGPCPKGMEARHFPDNTKTNCRLVNLQWGTLSQNQKDRFAHGTGGLGTANPMAKVTEEIVKKIRQRHANGARYCALAKEFNLCIASIAFIVTRKTWKHV